MINATHDNGQGQSPKSLMCPSWCVEHLSGDEGLDSELLLHRSEEFTAAGGYVTQLERADLVHRSIGATNVLINDLELTPWEAMALAGVLATTAAKADSDGETIIRTMDLPAGNDYVVMRDCNIIGLSSRLDEAGRRRALAEAVAR